MSHLLWMVKMITIVLIILLKMLQSDWLMKCKDIVIMTLCIFAHQGLCVTKVARPCQGRMNTLGCQDISWHLIRNNWNTNNGLSIVARNGESTHMHLLNENSVYVIACFQRICLILQTINYWGNKKDVLVLIQCHDGIITNSINLFAFYTRLLLMQDQTDLSCLW